MILGDTVLLKTYMLLRRRLLHSLPTVTPREVWLLQRTAFSTATAFIERTSSSLHAPTLLCYNLQYIIHFPQINHILLVAHTDGERFMTFAALTFQLFKSYIRGFCKCWWSHHILFVGLLWRTSYMSITWTFNFWISTILTKHMQIHMTRPSDHLIL